LEISPVRIIWFAALTWGRRRRAKIMKAFMGLLGVPSAFSAWERRDAFSSSSRTAMGERMSIEEGRGGRDTYGLRGCLRGCRGCMSGLGGLGGLSVLGVLGGLGWQTRWSSSWSLQVGRQ
jgi:hypothetical protein